MSLEKGSIVDGQFIILSLIHESKSMPSKVYLVQNINDQKAYVLKALSKGVFFEDDVSELFNRELKSLSILKHPNIVSILDSGETDKFYYLILEYISGNLTLENYIKNERLNELETLKIFKKILNGINHAHDSEIIHRDLSPTNILVDMFSEKVNVKIIDFGISKLKSFIFEETTTLNHYYNLLYSSPEQRDRKRSTNYSDIYSLGCILLFMIGKDAPKSSTEGIKAQIEELKASAKLKQILLKATHQDIISRYHSVESFINEINFEIEELESKDTSLYLKLTNSVTEDLYKLGIIEFPRKDLAKDIILKENQEFFVYRIKNEDYYIINNLIKFRCTIDKSSGIIILKRADEIRDYSTQEKEISRAFPIKSNIDIYEYPVSERDKQFLNRFLVKVDDEYKEFMNNQDKAHNQDRLITMWSEKIRQQENVLQKRKNVGYYSSIEYELESGFYLFKVEEIEEVDELSVGKKITIINKKKERQERVGEIKSFSNDIIKFSPETDFDFESFGKSGHFGIDYSENLMVTKRAKRALDTLKNGRSKNKNLLNIIVDPTIASVKQIPKSLQFANENIDDYNKQAVISALGAQDIFLIQGPPGTGKSTVINELIFQIKQQEKDSKILLASQSHVAVDHIFSKLKEYFPKDLLVRIGNSEKISKDSESNKILNQTKRWTDSIKDKSFKYIEKNEEIEINNELTSILKKISESDFAVSNFFKEKNKIVNGTYTQLEKDFSSTVATWFKSLDSLEGFDNLLLGKASIIASTCVGVSSNRIMDEMTFDWVIIDEAAKSTVPEVLIPIVKGKKVVLVGDHKQLPPIVNEFDDEILSKINKEKLTESLFEDLFVIAKNTDITLTLTKQFRMHPAISKMINRVFYTEGIEIITDIKEADRQINYRISKPIIWLSTERLKDNHQKKTNSKSYSNICEAKIIYEELKIINNMNAVDTKLKVGVISAYNGQKSVLEKIISPKSKEWENLNIIIENVDAFQGSEVDIVFYSVVRSNLERDIGFLSEQRRLNVALSRGKSQVIIVGNAWFMKEASKKEHNHFEDVLIHINRFPSQCELEVISDGH